MRCSDTTRKGELESIGLCGGLETMSPSVIRPGLLSVASASEGSVSFMASTSAASKRYSDPSMARPVPTIGAH